MDGLDKTDIEWFTCNQFLSRYPAVRNIQFEIGKSEAPDFIIKDESERPMFGLEITQAIFPSEGDLEARKVHCRANTIVDMGDKNWKENFKSTKGTIGDTIRNTSSEVASVIKNAISKKQEIVGQYKSNIPLVLCIRWTHLVWTELEEYLKKIETPLNTKFKEIWVAGFHLPELVPTVSGFSPKEETNCYGIYQIHPPMRATVRSSGSAVPQSGTRNPSRRS